MDIHEYQAKELLAGFGVAIPRGGVAYSPEQAVYRASEIGGTRWAVKAQIHSGARGIRPARKAARSTASTSRPRCRSSARSTSASCWTGRPSA
jgi:malate-CoA ligase subunit beta